LEEDVIFGERNGEITQSWGRIYKVLW